MRPYIVIIYTPTLSFSSVTIDSAQRSLLLYSQPCLYPKDSTNTVRSTAAGNHCISPVWCEKTRTLHLTVHSHLSSIPIIKARVVSSFWILGAGMFAIIKFFNPYYVSWYRMSSWNSKVSLRLTFSWSELSTMSSRIHEGLFRIWIISGWDSANRLLCPTRSLLLYNAFLTWTSKSLIHELLYHKCCALTFTSFDCRYWMEIHDIAWICRQTRLWASFHCELLDYIMRL